MLQILIDRGFKQRSGQRLFSWYLLLLSYKYRMGQYNTGVDPGGAHDAPPEKLDKI
jgi:hypothetical protein